MCDCECEVEGQVSEIGKVFETMKTWMVARTVIENCGWPQDSTISGVMFQSDSDSDSAGDSESVAEGVSS